MNKIESFIKSVAYVLLACVVILVSIPVYIVLYFLASIVAILYIFYIIIDECIKRVAGKPLQK